MRERRLIIKKRGTWKTKNTEETVKGFLQNDNRVFSRQQILKLVPSYENCNALRKILVREIRRMAQTFLVKLFFYAGNINSSVKKNVIKKFPPTHHISRTKILFGREPTFSAKSSYWTVAELPQEPRHYSFLKKSELQSIRLEKSMIWSID